uniref:Tumor necrosis factor receptor superfamily member 14 n=1 Tax=Maylandia zebra TaxID=106582 RepID=A0A3P9DF69_9CICH
YWIPYSLLMEFILLTTDQTSRISSNFNLKNKKVFKFHRYFFFLGHGLFVKRNCTAKTDTVCDVLNGYYCKGLIDSNGCSLAEKHSQCEAGQKIKESGTSRSDTVCEDCQPGFFSKDGVKCTAWKTCSNQQIKVKGSSTSDVVCGRTSSQHYFVFLPFLLCSVAFTSLVTG